MHKSCRQKGRKSKDDVIYGSPLSEIVKELLTHPKTAGTDMKPKPTRTSCGPRHDTTLVQVQGGERNYQVHHISRNLNSIWRVIQGWVMQFCKHQGHAHSITFTPSIHAAGDGNNRGGEIYCARSRQSPRAHSRLSLKELVTGLVIFYGWIAPQTYYIHQNFEVYSGAAKLV